MGPRSQAKFLWERRLNKAIKDFGPDAAGLVASEIASFEGAYKASVVNEDIPRRFQLKPLKGGRAPYKLWQIYAGADYRVIALFPKGRSDVHWIYAFKKTKDNNRGEIELAERRAKDWWEEVKGGYP